MPDIIVKNQTELDAALKAAKGGETIKLAAGTYTSLSIMDKNYATNVTITSLDPANKVNVSKLVVNKSTNVTIKDIDVKRAVAKEEFANLVHNSSKITLDGVTISGGTGDPSQALGLGLQIRFSSDIVMQNSSIDHFIVGLGAQQSSNVVIKNNSFHDNRRDHTNLSELTNVTIDSNSFTNLFPVGDEHPDAIQFWTANSTKASSNVTISNNVIMQGAGKGTQGIFIGGENPNLIYDGINITNNLLYGNGWSHGISVTNAKNVAVESNTVISKMDGVAYWIMLNGVDGAKVSNNVTDSIIVSQTSKNVDLGKNGVLGQDSSLLRSIVGLNDEGSARLADLLVPGMGYQPPKGSVAAALVQEQMLTAKPTNSSLLLDLSFKSDGLVEQSRWASTATLAPINASAVEGSSYHISTGVGIGLDRSATRQIYSLSAFTISFDLRRQAPTASVGDILGIYRSWGISLRADGEIMFQMQNASGQSYTVMTKGAKLTDTANHKIALTYDSTRSKLMIYVDGVERGSGTVTGMTRPVESWGLYVGGPYNRSTVNGTVGDIEIRDTALSAAQVQSLGATASADPVAALKYTLTKGLVSSATTLAAAAGGTNSTLLPATTVATTTTLTTATPQVTQLLQVLANQSITGSSAFSSSGLTTMSASKTPLLVANLA